MWHARTAKWREEGRLVVVGITQEQHAERCRLFAQWQGIEWPILWDAFNTTGAAVVPRLTLIDEHGVVRSLRPNPESVEAEFLDVDFPAPPASADGPPVRERLIDFERAAEGSEERAYFGALSDLQWSGSRVDKDAIATLQAYAKAHPEDAAATFRLGVAHRMRLDSAAPHRGDFQRSLDLWTQALTLDPNQYVWRRRIQQYGPRLDKPYPFYTWVERARAELTARGEAPVALRAALTGAETWSKDAAPIEKRAGPTSQPDPEGKIQRDDDGWIDVETAAAFHTSTGREAARVHIVLTPSRGVQWTNDAEPLTLWIGGAELPEGVTVSGGVRLLTVPVDPAGGAASDETRRIEVEVSVATEPGAVVELPGYALFHVCDVTSGECRYLRSDFVVRLVRPK